MELREIPEFIVEKGVEKGATDVAAAMVNLESRMIRFSNNKVSISKSYSEASASIYVMIRERRAAISISDLNEKSLTEAVERAIQTAKITPPADVYAPLPSGPFKYDESLLAPSSIPLDPSLLAGYVDEAIEGALEQGVKKVAGSLTATNVELFLATSSNVSASQTSSALEFSVRAFMSDLVSGHSVSVARREKDFNPRLAGREAAELAKAALNPVSGEPGTYRALLGPLVFADLVNQVGLLSSAFYVDVGQSFLVDKLGSEVASERFTLIDDPTLPNSVGSRAFDDEGLPTRRNVIVEKGVLKTYLHNSATAKKFGVESTSNAGYIVPTPWSLVVEPGASSYENLLSEIDRGVYVTNDWYLRYQNYRSGDFSTIPRDAMFLVENGEIVRSIRELRISDNMLRVFNNIVDLSRERKWVKWWEVEVPTYTPYALIDELRFTKSTV
ncbi:TldD/PmbA family protein [Candidatus Bathyarchaeota archaeon]|nr:TldD/PmbA family protein [Candidatus Bathyarchaeota archaeon]